MRFLVLPIFDGVVMDKHPIFCLVDAGVASIHHNLFIGCHAHPLDKKMIV